MSYTVELSIEFQDELAFVIENLKSRVDIEITQSHIDKFKNDVDKRLTNFTFNASGSAIYNGRYKGYHSFEISRHTFIFHFDRDNKVVHMDTVFRGVLLDR